MFDLFDLDGNGLVDAREFMTGVSLLAKEGRSPNDAVRAAFEAFDENGDGVISISEMIHYLTTVFTVLGSKSAELRARFAGMGVTPKDVAEATAERCFEDAGVPRTSRLTFDQFKQWYTSPDNQQIRLEQPVQEEPQIPSLASLREHTGLASKNVGEVLKVFRTHNPEGYVTRAKFLRYDNDVS